MGRREEEGEGGSRIDARVEGWTYIDGKSAWDVSAQAHRRTLHERDPIPRILRPASLWDLTCASHLASRSRLAPRRRVLLTASL